MPPKRDDERQDLDFRLVQPKLKELLTAAGNWVERSWPGARPPGSSMHPGARSLLLGLIRSSENTWRTVSYIAATTPPDPARRPEFVLSVSPLTRTVLEALSITIFIFGDLGRRVGWFYKSGWREVNEEYQRLAARHGADPDWTAYLAERKSFVDHVRLEWGVTDDEAAGVLPIRRFPIPDHMLREKTLAPDRREQLQYLLDWYYRRQSQDVHLSFPGVARRAALLLPAFQSDPRRAEMLRKIQADVVNQLVAMLLALVSEIEIECRFGMSAQAGYLWAIMSDFSDDTQDLYHRFYRDKLP